MTVTFGQDHIVFAGYEFPWAGVHPHGVLPASHVRDASPQVGPPEIRTVSGETLFLSWDDSAGLAEFCRHHGIEVAGRYSAICGQLRRAGPFSPSCPQIRGEGA